MLSGCTPEEQALATGLAVGAVGGAAVASHDHHHDYYGRPYYYHHGHYYYGGRYHNGYYYHNGHRYHGGHYYNNGYRYYNGRRYRAKVGEYGYRTDQRYRNYKRDTHVTQRRYTPSSTTRTKTTTSRYRGWDR
jgi:hypothetical protein